MTVKYKNKNNRNYDKTKKEGSSLEHYSSCRFVFHAIGFKLRNMKVWVDKCGFLNFIRDKIYNRRVYIV